MSKIFFVLILFSVNVFAQNQKVFLEIELEDVVGATNYEVEYKQKNTDKKKARTFSRKQPETIFKLMVDVGNYNVRTRSMAENSQSEWSEWFTLTALPDNPILDTQVQNQHFISKIKKNAEVPVVWNKSSGADKYQVIVQNVETEQIEIFKTRLPSYTLHLGKGRYRVGVQSVSKNNIKSEVTYFQEPFLVTEKKLERLDSAMVNGQAIQWKYKSHKNVKIDVYIKRFFSKDYVLLKTYESQADPWRIPKDLKPGEYLFRLQALSEEFNNSEIETHQLLIKPEEKDFKQQF